MGLEPATSGVTGRYGATGYSRLRPGIMARAGISSSSEPAVTGYYWLRPGRACVVRVYPARWRDSQQGSCRRFGTASSGKGQPFDLRGAKLFLRRPATHVTRSRGVVI
jgi:hypothetical protein